MIKYVSPFDHPAVYRGEPAVHRIKLASGGVGPNDAKAIIKVAGSIGHQYVKWAEDARERGLIHKDDVPTYTIAMGSKEYYAPNRNGDAFHISMLKKSADSFVSNPMRPRHTAWLYRNHKHDFDKDPHYGRIVKSAYNDEMGRVDVLSCYYGSKAATKREPNARVADYEVEAIERGDPVDVSMAVKLAFDRCSCCGNEAPTTKYYCREHDHTYKRKLVKACSYGGLHKNMGRVYEDGVIQYADNPAEADPYFFDLSAVGRHACRTASVLGALDGVKVASTDLHEVLFEDEADFDMTRPVPEYIKTYLSKLQEAERLSHGKTAAFDAALGHGDPDLAIELRRCKLGEAMASLSAAGAVWDLASFLAFASGEPADEYTLGKVAARLPGCWGRLGDEIAALSHLYRPADSYRSDFVERAEDAWSLKNTSLAARSYLAPLAGMEKKASARSGFASGADPLDRLVAHYCASRLACASEAFRSGTLELDRGAELMARQDRLQ
jgi:hypothetical protein